jgi:hypothetical protein
MSGGDRVSSTVLSSDNTVPTHPHPSEQIFYRTILSRFLPLPVRLSSSHSDTRARIFVWGVWTAILFFALFTLYRYGRNIPVVEDWLLVPAITGNENIPDWLWRQNSEHRVPLPKLILFGLLKLTHGDFRVGAYFNILIVGAASALMISGLRHLRGGTTRIVDAFVPLTLLHMGHWENFSWSWQLTQTFACVLILLMILTTVLRPYFDNARSAIFGGLGLVCLPLCGAPGMLASTFFGPWLTYCTIRNHSLARKGTVPRWISMFLFSCVLIAATLAIFYLRGLPVTGYFKSPSFAFTLSIFFRFLGMSMGLAPVAPYTFILVVLLSIASLALIGYRFVRLEKEEKPRAIALGMMLIAWIFFCFLTAAARAGLIFSFPRVGPMSRYILMFSPIILIPFFVWELYGTSRLKVAIQTVLLTTAIILVPINYRFGSQWGAWYLQTYEKVRADIQQGESAIAIARTHKDDLAHWYKPERLAEQIKMLHDAKMTIFAHLPERSFAEASRSLLKTNEDDKSRNR